VKRIWRLGSERVGVDGYIYKGGQMVEQFMPDIFCDAMGVGN
jgi:hypothetical protein